MNKFALEVEGLKEGEKHKEDTEEEGMNTGNFHERMEEGLNMRVNLRGEYL